jgi:hypothetical protein
MHLILCDSAGRRVEGLLLAASKYRLRVVRRGASDVTELRQEFGQWMFDTGEHIELEALTTDGTYQVGCIIPRTFGAGTPAYD